MGRCPKHPPGRATYLPQVWEQIPDPKRFLASLARKAGLDSTVYSDPTINFSVYYVDIIKYLLRRV
ncbi:AMMECR1 domain-containing protein [Oceanithermus profundus]|uniref:AMMECR1 domain-containing protein n=1 Tax=Oceanithermus profundus TaxID=187137 RepID=UPI0011D1A06C|nr:AMMECR1 domain-containing protein [Oceanithermus profundus]